MRTRLVKIGLGTAAPLLGFSGVALGTSRLLNLQGSTRTLLFAGLGVLGLASAILVFRYLSRILPQEAPEDRPEREIDEIFAEVRDKLRAARLGGGKIGRLPIVVFLGPRGGTKTTLIERGGVDPELLAGAVYRGTDVAPTRNANVWLGGETLFVEAGGEVLEDEGRWSRLVQHLRPVRLAAVLGRGRQPPRLAVVCFPCVELRRDGNGEALTTSARFVRERLHELSRSLGVRLPVYVLFTKADRIDHFEAFVEPFTAAEAQEVLGATLPLDRGRGGSYAERESDRWSAEFDRLFRSLAGRRPELLQRESEAQTRSGIYEFPRELLKIRDAAVRFLVELGRPSRLAVSPITRGFYFTGVRPVVPEEAGAPDRTPEHPARGAPVGATAVFRPGDMQAAPSRPRAARGSGRVPEWAFVRRLFRDLLLGDRVAMGVTAGGARVNLLRRALAGGALALAAICVIGVLTSYFRNRSLEREVVASLAAVEDVSLEGRDLSAGDLERLHSLGAHVRRLRDWEVDRPPAGLRWGLYRGDDLLTPARTRYFEVLEQPLAVPARSELVDDLEALPVDGSGTNAAPYDTIYQDLKAYLVITEFPDSSQVDFLAPVLATHRLRGLGRDSAYAALALEQFRIYARELPYGDPYRWTPNDALIAGARAYLAGFASEDQVYRRMIENASGTAAPVEFSGTHIASDHPVRGAFTRQGWEYIERGLRENVERLLRGEEWVTGPQDFSEGDIRGLQQNLWARYQGEYVQQWQAHLRGARISGLGSVSSAARALEALSSNRSPLLELLAGVAVHTNVSDTVRSAFRPVHVVTPPPPDTADDDETPDLIGDSNRGYIGALAGVASAMTEAADARGDERNQALQRAADASRRVADEVAVLQQGFGSEALAVSTEADVRRLLQTPADAAIDLGPRVAAGDMRGRLQSFCEEFAPLLSAYPFNPRSDRDATIDDIDALLKPREGRLWTFPQDELADVLIGGGPGSYRARADASPRPSGQFVDFLNEAATIAEALYSGGGDSPQLSFGVRFETPPTLPHVVVTIDSRNYEFEERATQVREIRWVGRNAGSAIVAGRIDGSLQVLLRREASTWALFRLLDDAEWSRGGTRPRLRWPLEDHDQTLQAELFADDAIPILNPAGRGNLRCVAGIETG